MFSYKGKYPTKLDVLCDALIVGCSIWLLMLDIGARARHGVDQQYSELRDIKLFTDRGEPLVSVREDGDDNG